MKLRLALLATTALVGFATPAAADPVSMLVAAGATALGSAATAIVTGTTIAWSALAGQALVAGVLAGASSLMATKPQGPKAQDITLNKITPVTTGLIIYGRRMVGGSIIGRSTTKGDSSNSAFTSDKKNAIYHSVIPLACHEIDGFEEVWFGETKVWTEAGGMLDTKYKGHIKFRFRYGTADQNAVSDYVNAANGWKDSSRGRGIAYLYTQLTPDSDGKLFTRGAEPIRVLIRGKKVYDPRTDTTGYSSNPALCLRDYALTPENFGGVGWQAEDIDDAAIIALANIADEQVAKAGGGTHDRYKYNGALDTASSPEENFNRLSTAWGGWWTVDRGKLTVGGGAYEVPTFTLTEDMMAGPMKVRARRPFEEQFNVVKAVFADKGAEYTPTDLPVLSSDTYKAQDNGEELVRDLGELPGETNHARGQRLMKLALLKGRRQRMVDVPCTLAAWNVRLGETIRVTVPRRGWTDKTFEVVKRAPSVGPGKVQVNLGLIETGPDVFDWTTSEETAQPAGDTPELGLPTDQPIVEPPQVVEQLYSSRGGGGVKSRVVLTTDSDNPFVARWQFAYRLISDPEFTERPDIGSRSDLIDDFKPGIYIFGARATTNVGIVSGWSYTGQVEIFGLNALPAAITGVSTAAISGLVTLRWVQHPDLDVRQGGQIEIRHSTDPLATWQTSTSIGKAVPGSATMTTLPAISGRYLLRATDSQGRPGPVTTIDTTAPDFQNLTTVGSITESPGFSGAKTNCTVSGSALQLDAGQVSAEYEFASQMDLGSLTTVRITSQLAVLIADRSNLFDSDELFDSVAMFDGSGEADGDVNLFYSASDVSPASWGPWIEFDRTDIEARLLKFKAVLTSTSDQYRTDITTLGAIAEST